MAHTDNRGVAGFGRLAAYGTTARVMRRQSRHTARQAIRAGEWDTLTTRERHRTIAWQCCDDGRRGLTRDIRWK